MLEKIAGLGKILETTLNTVLSLANSIGTQLVSLEGRIQDLEARVSATPNSSLKAPVVNPMATEAMKATNHSIQKIEEMAVASRRNLEQMQLTPPPNTSGTSNTTSAPEGGDRDKISQTRANILKELQMLIKKTKPLKD